MNSTSQPSSCNSCVACCSVMLLDIRRLTTLDTLVLSSSTWRAGNKALTRRQGAHVMGKP